jgi:HEAT repeat protein
MIRSAAVNALAEIGDRSVIPALRLRLTDADRIVRVGAAAALKRLGVSEGDALLAEGLAHALPEVRLLAASGFKGTDTGSWIAAIRPILQEMSGRYRLIAAELLMPVDRPAALDAIRLAAKDENPWIRAAAARRLASDCGLDLELLFALLRDASAWARLHASGRLAHLGREATATPPRNRPTRKAPENVR